MAQQGQSLERLREYLGQLPPQAHALLMREFERAIEAGRDVAVATFVLNELRKLVRPPEQDAEARAEHAVRAFFRALDPFLVDNEGRRANPGHIRRSSLLPAWTWIERELAPEDAAAFKRDYWAADNGGNKRDADHMLRAFQIKVADAILAIVAKPATDSERQRHLNRIGSAAAADDVAALGLVLKHRELLESLPQRLPNFVRNLADEQFHLVRNALDSPVLQSPQVLPLALALTMRRIAAPWQVIRLATAAAGSDEAARIATTPYAIAVTMALDDVTRIVATLRDDLKRARYNSVSNLLKQAHDAVRGLRTELDVGPNSDWGRQLATIRTDISNLLKSEIDTVPGRVRRLLRQRPDKEIAAGTTLDAAEVAEIAALIDFVSVCRTYASELAINEVTLRAYSDIQQYLERSTQALLDGLRVGDPKHQAFRQSQVNAAIRFCSVMFGDDYASLMTRAADVAISSERKASTSKSTVRAG